MNNEAEDDGRNQDGTILREEICEFHVQVFVQGETEWWRGEWMNKMRFFR